MDRLLITNNVPYGATLLVKDGQNVGKGTAICSWDPFNNVVVSEIAGAIKIAEQVFAAARDLASASERVTNVVVMGMGEPFLNYDETLLALKVLNDGDGFNLAARHIAVSTSGLVDRIRRFADEPEQFHLAISLHTPFQDEREEIMPIVEISAELRLIREAPDPVHQPTRRDRNMTRRQVETHPHR